MTVLHLANCPPALRGDLTKWLMEIATGVYVGKISARVRDNLWDRVVKTCKSGRAVLVYNADNEQKMDFRIHGESWEPIDFDGIKLMLRPSPARIKEKQSKLSKEQVKHGFSNAARFQAAKRFANPMSNYPDSYVVIDLETTGLNHKSDKIIEIGAIKVEKSVQTDSFQALIAAGIPIPANITILTGIDDNILTAEGKVLEKVVPDLLEFTGKFPLVAHNMEFDIKFLNYALAKCNILPITNRLIDTCDLTKRLHKNLIGYKLEQLVEYFKLGQYPDTDIKYQKHRSLGDCYLTHLLYQKLLNFEKELE
jgi:CRISPR-associated protein Cas2